MNIKYNIVASKLFFFNFLFTNGVSLLIILSIFFTQNLPSGFIKKCKRGTTRTVMLQVANQSWPVKLLVYPRASYKLSAGWSAFMKENTLKEGDVCVFELIKRDDVVFKVNIFRGLN